MTYGQKFQRGYRVKILSRFPEGLVFPEGRATDTLGGRWENTGVGEEAIIKCSSIERPNYFNNDTNFYEEKLCYTILILYNDGYGPRINRWFEEKYLELICCNEAKGERILKENNIP